MKCSAGVISSAALIAFLIQCSLLFGGSSPNIPVDNHVYRDIDKLIAAGLIQDALYGQRPWSRNEIVRMLVSARGRLREIEGMPSRARDMAISLMAEEILRSLESEYYDEITEKEAVRFHPLEEILIDGMLLDSPFRTVPENNGLAGIKASVNPLLAYREGRKYVDGNSFAIESVHWMRPSKDVSFYVRPRMEVLDPGNASAEVNVGIQTLYGKVTHRNVELEFGRDSLIWGQGESGGVLASSNARNVNLFKISNDSPFALPSVFRCLGPSKFTFILANLGSDYVLKNAYVYGLAASFKPVPLLEIGFKHQTTVGGEGSPSVSLWQMVREFFMVRASGWPQESMDNREGFDVRVQIPQLHRAFIYAEGVFEDFGRESFWPQFTEQMGFSSGLYFPLLTSDGANDLRFEYEHSPAAYGRHYLYTSGLTLDNRLRGSEIGPDGTAFHVIWRHVFPSNTLLRGEAHYEGRRGDTYRQTPTENGGVDRVIRVTNHPIERRLRFTTSLDWRFDFRWIFRPQIGYERVWNFNWDSNISRNNFLGTVSLVWYPGY
jgi:hypothetical protein